MKKFILLVIIPLFGINCNDNPYKCKFKNIKVQFVEGNKDMPNSRFVHTLILKDFAKECMDSTTVLNIVHNYIDTIGELKPVSGLYIYNSDERFIPSEVSQNVDEILKDCLFDILFEKDMTIEMFRFYNNDGKKIYEGKLWRPFGEKYN